ncbi:PGF-pre-PGF domain-containing protein [Methanosarcina vacuolata]|uniref:Cell surface protein n=1 Tax=Methanosarcina vacuolata Z-761 TaxID=1434123 RepID=A0A0E3Q3U5_9EURY|nr:PGF-pre-PGF domain-containing protein [Methanosarcina vacuolata]AKB43180.1 cell surface protein [Methanosarcina vacuolata Z-761]
MTNKKKLNSIPLTASLLFFLIFGSCIASAGTETRLIHGERLTSEISFSGNYAFWTESAGNDVHAYDLTTGKRTDISGHAADGQINAHEKTRIKTSTTAFSPSIYNDKIVYADNRNLETNPDVRENDAGNSTVTKPNSINVTPPQAQVADFAAPNNTIVYGFWPSWSYLESYQPDWNTLTHVSYSKWTVNSDGTLTDPANMSNYYVIRNQAHQRGVKVTLCIYSNDPYVMDSVIANHQTDFINNISNSLQMYGADGVNLDLETPTDINSITGTSNVPLFENLMANLHITLKAANPAYHISLDVPWGIKYAATFKNANLTKYTDSVFLMSYDYCNRKTTAPNSPYNSSIRYDAIDSISETSKYFNKSQIILGLPFYGYDYSTDSNQPGANITREQAIFIGTAVNNSQVHGRIWDSDSNTPWYFYKAGDTWHQVWYDDDESLKLKYQYAKSENLGGVGFWALGYERNYSNIWKVFQLDPVADFSASVTSGYTPLSVQFTDLSQHAILRNWNFGDENTSTEQNPLHTYSAAGTYIINLTVSNGNHTASKTATIIVFEENNSSGGTSGSGHRSSSGDSSGSGHSSSSVGGGGGGSPELQSNVQVKELSQAAVINGKSVTFDFPKNVTCVVYVNFDSKKTFGKTTAITEQLKEKSSLVSILPDGEVYRSFNVWVGNGGIATSKNMENPIVCFKVEKSWVKDKDIDKSSITLNRYNDKKWEQFPVSLLGEDNEFLYFTAKTSGFSSFAITGTVKPLPEEIVTKIEIDYPETINNTSSKEPQTEQNEIPSTPGFEIYYGIASLFAVLLYKRK